MDNDNVMFQKSVDDATLQMIHEIEKWLSCILVPPKADLCLYYIDKNFKCQYFFAIILMF